MAETNGAVLNFTRDAAFINRRAHARRDAGEDINALRLFRRASAEAPDNVNYRVDLAEMLNCMGCIRASYDEIARMINDGSLSYKAMTAGETDASALFGQACNLSTLGYTRSALEFVNLVNRYPHAEENQADIDGLSTQLIARELLDNRSRVEMRLISRMERYHNCGDAGHAYAVASRYLRHHAKSPLAHAAMAWAEMLRRDQPASTEHLVQALAMTQQDPWVLSIAARIMSGGDNGQARPALERAFTVSDNYNCDAVLLRQAIELNMHALVLDISGRMLESNDGEPRLSACHAAAMINTGKPARTALGVLRHSLEVYPGDITATHYVRLAENFASHDAPLNYPDREMLDMWAKGVSGMRTHIWKSLTGTSATPDMPLMGLLEWGLNFAGGTISQTSSALLANLGGDAARDILWRFLASYELPDELRSHALVYMALAGMPLPRLIFLGGKLRRLNESVLYRMMNRSDGNAEILAAARRLHRYPNAIIDLHSMMPAAGKLNCGLHMKVSALECAYRLAQGEALNLRAIARRRHLNSAKFAGAVNALVHTIC